ncbi:MAG: nickel-dependent hydrogenase large subunit [Archaeoglobaceae archaeon]
MANVVVDPVTRIEGHLRIEMETEDVETSTGTWQIVNTARSSGTLFRGWETILRNRDPRDAWFLCQRICGVCPAPHAEASIQAIEQAFDVQPTPSATLIRNVMHGAYYIYDHLIHTYLLVGPELGVLANYPPMVPPALGKDGISKLGLGSSYAKCVEMQRKANEIVALWGGRFPHHASEYPGGMTLKPTMDKITRTFASLSELYPFITHTMVNDLNALLEANPHIGEAVSNLLDVDFRGLQDLGVSTGNFLSYGIMPDPENYDDWLSLNEQPGRRESALIQAGAWDGDFKDFDISKIEEYLRYSWYDNTSGQTPSQEGAPDPNKDKDEAYSWVKAPRYDGKVYEVGPIARMVNTFGTEWKAPRINPFTGEDPGEFEYTMLNPKGSVIDRVAGRVAATLIIANKMYEWLNEMKDYVDQKVTNYKDVPQTGEGFGLYDAPRGALLHYLRIEDHKIGNYQAVVPSTWNLGPRDDTGQPGPVETALEGTWLPELDVPTVASTLWPDENIDLTPLGVSRTVNWGEALETALEPLGLAPLNMEPTNGGQLNTSLALATIRSFDPCIACAVHMLKKR